MIPLKNLDSYLVNSADFITVRTTDLGVNILCIAFLEAFDDIDPTFYSTPKLTYFGAIEIRLL